MTSNPYYSKVKNLGSGASGNVYEAVSPGGSKVAIKCNIKSSDEDFISCSREMHINYCLGIHPYILPLDFINVGNPFKNGCMSPIAGCDGKYKYDDVHFIYPLAEGGDLNNYLEKNASKLTMSHIKRFMMQALLALEYVHGSGYIHRDIKGANILVIEKGDDISVRLADFGHAKPYIPNIDNTPRVTTSWWRAPEQCLGSKRYTQVCDVWSLGCVFYTMISGRYITSVNTDDNAQMISDILSSLPYNVNGILFNKMNISKYRVAPPLRRTPPKVSQFLYLTDESKDYIDKIGGYDNFVDVLMGMLSFDPNGRKTTTQCLNSPFFDEYREHINSIREAYPPQPPSQSITPRIVYPERKIAMGIPCNIFTNRTSLKWYGHRALFSSINAFDKALAYIHEANKGIVPEGERILNDRSTFLLYIACLYFYVKYYSSIQKSIPYNEIVLEEYRNPSDAAQVKKYEDMLIKNILKYDLHTDTIYDVACKHFEPNYNDVWGMLMVLINGHHSNMCPNDAYYKVWLPNKSFYNAIGW